MVFAVCITGVSWGQTHVFVDKTWNNTNSIPNANTVPGAALDGIIIYSNVNLVINDVSIFMNTGASIQLEPGATLTLESINQPTLMRLNFGGTITTINNSVIDVIQSGPITNKLELGASGIIHIKELSSLNVNGATVEIGQNGKLLAENSTVNLSGANIGLSLYTQINLQENSVLNSFGSDISFGFNAEMILDNSIVNVENSHFNMGDNSRIFLTSSCGSLFDAKSTEFSEPSSPLWRGIEISKSSCGPHGLQEQFAEYPLINNDGNCTASEWEGILVTSANPLKLNGVASRIQMDNCNLYNAELAINVDGENNYYTGGGIARIRNTTFTNCQKGIRIAGWNKRSPNASHIMTCDFVWNDALQFPNSLDLQHIVFESLDESFVRVGGCSFKNLQTSTYTLEERGIGIYADNSSFTLSKDGDRCCPVENGSKCPDNCFGTGRSNRGNTFQNLGQGIVFNTGTRRHKFTCRYSDFVNCVFGIKAENSFDVQIGDNTFSVDKANIDTYFPVGYSTSPTVKQIYFKNSSGVRIHDNAFSHDLYYIAGIVMEDPDQTQTSFIRNNTFTSPNQVLPTCGPQVKAIELYGNNNHLDITCNTFVNHVYDVYLHSYASLNDIPDLDVHSSGNIFSSNTWSILPTRTTPLPDNEQLWQTQGCASNVFIGVNASNIDIYHRYDFNFGQISGQMKFEVNSYSKTNQPHLVILVPNEPNDAYKYPKCNSSSTDCVDCSTECDKLGINKTGTLGLDQMTWDNTSLFAFYPNPSSKSITIMLNRAADNNTNLKIIDMLGKIVYDLPLTTNTTTISLHELNLSSGVYSINIENGELQSNAKLIYQND